MCLFTKSTQTKKTRLKRDLKRNVLVGFQIQIVLDRVRACASFLLDLLEINKKKE